MKRLNQKGNILLFAVVAMTAIAVLGTGIYFMTTTATFSGLGANQQNRAYQLAIAGRDYALVKNLGLSNSGDYTMSNGDIFRLVISGDTITSTGIVNIGTPYEAKRTIMVTKTGFGSQADISFANFAPSIKQTQAGYVNVDQAAAQISLGQFQASQFGSVWYGGTSALGNCQNGKCDFGSGFRTYFLFKLERQSADIPHGFTFAFFNGADNNNSSAGGDFGMPELLAYGGDSCTSRNYLNVCTGYLDAAGKGINPPKIAIEFDGRQNAGSNLYCHPTFSGNSDSRNDGARNHMAYVFWGDNTTACSNRENSLTYDDNRHGAGGATDPINAVSTDVTDNNDYYVGLSPFGSGDSNWLFSTTKVYAVRVEVTRASDKNTNNKYFYTINTWIKRCNSDTISDSTSCSEIPTYTDFNNTKAAYNPTTDPPTLKRTIELDPSYHVKFNQFLFGWTAAAGSASREQLSLNNFQMYFIRESAACGGYGVWNNLGSSGSTTYFKINGTGCTGIVKDSFIGNIGPSGSINGYTNSSCTTASSPLSISYDQAVSADTNKNCAVNFSGTDK